MTALSYLLHMPNLRMGTARQSRASVIPRSMPTDASARALLKALSLNLSESVERLDVLVASRGGRYQTSSARGHLCLGKLPTGSFIPADAFGIEFHVSSPELVFLQMAEEVEFDQLVYVGFALCSSFRLDDLEVGGCLTREGGDEPLTSVERIRTYLERLPKGTRNRAVALRALRHVRDGARSPLEAGLAMLIGMPVRLGGWALGETSMNQEIRVYDGVGPSGEPRWRTRVPDILVMARDRTGTQRRVGVDYDARSVHSAPDRAARDVDRRNLLASAGDLTHITFDTRHARSFTTFCLDMDRVRRALGQRRKPRLTGSPDSARNRRIEARVAARQFELWNRVLGEGRLKL